MKKWKAVLVLFFVGIGIGEGNLAWAQEERDDSFSTEQLGKGGKTSILDDSTQLLYNERTLYFNLEDEIKQNFNTVHWLDTTLYNLEKWSSLETFDYKLQNLGNIR
ncbi:MAG: hypothetical protein MI784_17890, partial [Cytophagales bacterium]|nr:hypothetical protein [Cytophagales bacterium]